MKLVKKEVKTVYTLADNIKVGDFLQLEDTLSCDIIQCKLLSVDNKGIKVVKLSNLETREYTYEQLEKFEFRKLRLGVVGETTTQQKETLREPIKQPSKKECEKATDAYEKQFIEALRDALGINTRVVNLAR